MEKSDQKKNNEYSVQADRVCCEYTGVERCRCFYFGMDVVVVLQGLSTDNGLISAYPICAAEQLQKEAMYETARNHCRML